MSVSKVSELKSEIKRNEQVGEKEEETNAVNVESGELEAAKVFDESGNEGTKINAEGKEEEIKETNENSDSTKASDSESMTGQKRKSNADLDYPDEKRIRKAVSDEEETKMKKTVSQAKAVYKHFAGLLLPEYRMQELVYPRPHKSGKPGHVILYGSQFGFHEGCCKRCQRTFDTTFSVKTKCDFHKERSKRFSGRQQPHGCCGRSYGSKGCHSAPNHVFEDNLYTDLKDYKTTEKKENSQSNYEVYAVDTESIHTKKGLEVCRVTIVDRNLKVVYNEFCLPTTEVIDYNTIWSGITEKDLKGVTKTFEEMREDMLELFSEDTILVGHGLNHDLLAMKIVHNKVIDTLFLYPHHRGWPLKRSLKDIALTELGMRIQGGCHDSEEDAKVAMKLVLKKVKPFIK